MEPPRPDLVTLTTVDGTGALVLDLGGGVPAVVHWGAPLDRTDGLAVALDRPLVAGGPDAIAPLTLCPEHGAGFAGRPGFLGHRGGGRDWAPRLVADGHELAEAPGGGTRLVARAVDPIAGVAIETVVEVGHVVTVRLTLENRAERYVHLDGLTVTVPVPDHADELLTFSGRWAREMRTTRRRWDEAAFVAENRHGRTSHELPPFVVAGSAGFGEWHGDVWGAHVAWSGNHTILADRLPDGRRYLQLGELLHPGEVVLAPGERYATPEVLLGHSGTGLTPLSWAFHRHLRAREAHPTRPRPVLLNTWEAVYFDHDAQRLRDLATTAASLGVERFVLDDGWFGSRRDDTRGLGDWWVSPDVYPDGLTPLIGHVRSLGMEFGIWVEPEMVNPDSDLYRAHPDWTLTTDGYEPVLSRNQLVLDLGHPDAYAHVLERLDALVRDHDIAFLKWDLNRDHVQGSGAGGAAGTHAHVLATYRLLDELRARHPGLEIESCASGGGRIDAEILRRTERVWTSDCNDALERQWIQRGLSMFVPPELMGAHIGPTRSHTTGRVHTLAFRAATAMFGHLGVEWDVLALDDRERTALRDAIALHVRFRELLHHGDTVRFDAPDPYLVHGVYAADRTEALVSIALVATAPSLTPPAIRLPGLDPDRTYAVRHLALPGERWGAARRQPAWLTDGVDLTGRQLAVAGLRPPVLHPESALLVHLTDPHPTGPHPTDLSA